MVRLVIVSPWNPNDGEVQRAREFATGPVQRIKTGTLAGIDAIHLANDHFGIGVNAKSLRIHRQGYLQGFEEGDVLGDIVIVVAYPSGNTELAAG
jgi:hypothetical protein